MFRQNFTKWMFTLAVCAVIVAGALFAIKLLAPQQTAELAEVKKKLEGGRVKLTAKEAELHIQTAKVKDIDWLAKYPVYGRVITNPSATIEVRTSFAGRLRQTSGGKWPALAAQVKRGELLGQLEVRPVQDRFDLIAKLGEARVKLEGSKKIWTYQQDRVKRFELAQPSIPRSELDSALVAMAESETQVAVNEAAAKLWQDALAALDQRGDLSQMTWTLPVVAPTDGEVTELVARPESVVEAGSLIARIVDFRKALVRLDVPVNLVGQPPKTVGFTILPATPPAFTGPTNRPEPPEAAPVFSASFAGTAGQVDATAQTAGYLYHVNNLSKEDKQSADATLLRPGLFVKAQLEIPGKTVPGFAVPKSALLYHQGRGLVYIEKAATTAAQQTRFFERVEVGILGREGDALIVSGSLIDGDNVVSEGALYLLSAEFRTDTDD